MQYSMLSEVSFRSEDVAPPDRFDYWREHLLKAYAPAQVLSRHAADFVATQRIVELGPVRLWTVEHPSMTLRRSSRLIRQADPEMYHLSIPLRGAMHVVGSRRAAEYGARDAVLLDTSHPHVMDASASGAQGRIKGVGLFLPRDVLPLRANSVGELINRPLPGRDGLGTLLAQLLTRVLTDTSCYRLTDGPRLGKVVIDLVSALVAHALGSDDALVPETRRHTLLLRIRQYIQDHLHEPELTPRSVAAAHHISVSYLHRIFEGEQTSVAALIRHQRLESARRHLADPALRSMPVHLIAARCGFARAADLTRAFRVAYGLPPTEYRNQACAPEWTHCELSVEAQPTTTSSAHA
ncbi:helix-turn-helix domain-containing protein [Streptomyces sp. NPDC023588]|uniref:AraC-like ligand-binding domain-containing protein n=1 Tax=Streptomyces sp. NPDC023588 TaxID=3154907 RepID=UPI0033C74D29